MSFTAAGPAGAELAARTYYSVARRFVVDENAAGGLAVNVIEC